MSQVRVFTLVGDSNIRNHINKNSLRANPALKAAQILTCGHMGIFSPSLQKIRAESNACVVACVTNFLTSAEGPPSISNRVEPVLSDFFSTLVEYCVSNPDRSFLISPPMYRSQPTWYREGLPEIMTLFSQSFSNAESRPPNLLLLPSFATPEFDADGIHLTPYSGLEYILHLFDSAIEVIESTGRTLEEVSTKCCESTRVLEDRVMVLEQEHRRLNRVVESKTAIDSELADTHANERSEDFFVIAGTPRIASDLVGKAWQEQAVKDVQSVIQILMGREMSIVFVKNATSRHDGAEVTYNVQMSTVAESDSIRKKFGSFFVGAGGVERRPTELRSISIKNLVTPETRIRISLLKLIGQKYRDSNPRSKVQVIGYVPRPFIKITPSPSASDRRVLSYTFVQAVKALPCQFSASELEPIVRRINPRLSGQVRSLFIIISDDQYRKVSKFRNSRPATTSTSTEVSNTGSASGTSGSVSDDGDDNDVTITEAMAVVPVPPAAHQSSSKGSRSGKRGAPSHPDAVPAKK